MILTSYIRVHAVVWECGEGQTDRQCHTCTQINIDTQTAVTTTHFDSAMPHAKCNNCITCQRTRYVHSGC